MWVRVQSRRKGTAGSSSTHLVGKGDWPETDRPAINIRSPRQQKGWQDDKTFGGKGWFPIFWIFEVRKEFKMELLQINCSGPQRVFDSRKNWETGKVKNLISDGCLEKIGWGLSQMFQQEHLKCKAMIQDQHMKGSYYLNPWKTARTYTQTPRASNGGVSSVARGIFPSDFLSFTERVTQLLDWQCWDQGYDI